MSDDNAAEMRAGDSDRDRVAERLRVALEEGRLNLIEYDERLRQAYGAKTFGELNRLLTDLPQPASAARSQVVPATGSAPAHWTPDAQGIYPHATRRWLAENWTPYLGVVAVCTVVWLFSTFASGGFIYFWPGWVAGPWGAVLLVATISGLATGEPQKWAQKKARKEAEEEARERAKAEREARDDG